MTGRYTQSDPIGLAAGINTYKSSKPRSKGRRPSFSIHPGTMSLGCITVDKHDEKLMQDYELIDSLLQREDGHNTLEVVP